MYHTPNYANSRPMIVVRRMNEIHKAAARLQMAGLLTDSDWGTHPLAIEYRALMVEWWAFPASPQLTRAMAESHTAKQSAVSTKPLAPLSAGELWMQQADRVIKAKRAEAAVLKAAA